MTLCSAVSAVKVNALFFHLPRFQQENAVLFLPVCLLRIIFDLELMKNFVMKTILNVVRTDDQKIRFETDLDVKKNPYIVLELIEQFSLTMITTLWGGNEQTVLAVIRALAIADLSVSVNRKDMVRFLDETSRMAACALQEAKKDFVRSGGKFVEFAPGVKPGGFKS